jgi:hypothetical protein
MTSVEAVFRTDLAQDRLHDITKDIESHGCLLHGQRHMDGTHG